MKHTTVSGTAAVVWSAGGALIRRYDLCWPNGLASTFRRIEQKSARWRTIWARGPEPKIAGGREWHKIDQSSLVRDLSCPILSDRRLAAFVGARQVAQKVIESDGSGLKILENAVSKVGR